MSTFKETTEILISLLLITLYLGIPFIFRYKWFARITLCIIPFIIVFTWETYLLFLLPMIVYYPLLLLSHYKVSIFQLRIPGENKIASKMLKRISWLITILSVGFVSYFLYKNNIMVEFEQVSMLSLITSILFYVVTFSLLFYFSILYFCYYILFPALSSMHEEKEGKLSDFFTFIEGTRRPTVTYCIAFEGLPEYFTISWSDYLQLIEEKGSTYRYCIYTGPWNSIFIQRKPSIIQNISENQKVENNHNYNLTKSRKSIIYPFILLLYPLVFCSYFLFDNISI
ncbi:MAG: hypothetical protein ACK5LC_00385, partial [Coprobacillaceae bacterium]